MISVQTVCQFLFMRIHLDNHDILLKVSEQNQCFFEIRVFFISVMKTENNSCSFFFIKHMKKADSIWQMFRFMISSDFRLKFSSVSYQLSQNELWKRLFQICFSWYFFRVLMSSFRLSSCSDSVLDLTEIESVISDLNFFKAWITSYFHCSWWFHVISFSFDYSCSCLVIQISSDLVFIFSSDFLVKISVSST